MKKAGVITAIAAAVVVVGGVLFWQQGGQISGGDEPLSAWVPDDTVLYMGGTPDAGLGALFERYPLRSMNPAEVEAVFEQLAAQHGSLPAAAQLLRALLTDFTDNVSTYGELARHYGLDLGAEQAFYLHGVYPVVRLPLKDVQAFNAVWQRVGEQAGLSPQREQREGLELARWRLSDPARADYLDLVVAQPADVGDAAGLATLTLFSSLDSEQQQLERLGLRKPARSLLESGELNELNTRHQFNPSFSGFVHLHRLASGLLQVDEGRLAKDVQSLVSHTGQPSPLARRLDAACRAEVAGMFAALPRLAVGYTRIERDGDQGYLGARSIFEIQSEAISTPLQALRGHLPGHLQQTQLLGLGLATDMDQLAPTLMQLWRQASEAQFTCPELQALQNQLRAANPAPLGVATGMMQGIKGLGVSLFGLELPEQMGGVVQADMLLSLATENPELVISLLNTTLIPQSAGQLPPLPLDGQPTVLNLGQLQPGLRGTFARQGQHLVFYTGTQAEKAAQALSDEALAPNGLLAMSVDYPALAAVLEGVPAEWRVALRQEPELCEGYAALSEALIAMPVREQIRMDLEPKGLATDVSLQFLSGSDRPIPQPIGCYGE